MKPKDSAKMILKSIQNFTSQTPRHLKKINFVIYQDGMMKEFQEAVTHFKTKKSGSKMGGLFGFAKGIYRQYFGMQK